MSSFTSDDEVGDELEIKPPQAQLSSGRDRRGREKDRHGGLTSRYLRMGLDDRHKKEFEPTSIPRQRLVERHRSGSSHVDRGYRSEGRGNSERLDGSSSASRSSSHRKSHGDKYSGDSKSRRSDDRRKELEEQKLKRKNIEQESERYFREVERKREQERREEVKRQEGRGDKRIVNVSRSRSITPPHSEHEMSDHEEHEDSRIDSRDRSKDIGKESKSSLSLFPEVEDIEESSSDLELEDGEQISPARSHSDVSDSDHEEKSDNSRKQQNIQEDSLHSDVSDRATSSRSQSESPSDSKPSTRSKSSDSEQESRVDRRNGGGSDNGERPSKIFKGDSPGTPESDGEPRKPGSDVEILEGNSHDKTTTGNSESAEVEEATDVLNLLPPYYPALQGCRRVEEFKLLNRIEEGTYGVVYRAEDRRTSEIVALKRLKMEKEKDGFPITSLREINTLLKAQHENIVTVREIVVGSNTDKIFLVMDYVEHDLKSLMETLKQKGQAFIVSEVKCLMIQLLRAVAHLHDNWILHRDLKTSNLLLSHKGILKVGDFGLAREYGSPLKQYTPIVVTLWYRAPELLLQMKDYSCPIDVWSVGCIFGELLKMEPMFPGKSEANQLNLIFQTLGTPNDKIWPGYSKLPLLQKMTFADYPVNKLKTRFHRQDFSDIGIDLMNKFLTFNPAKRITAEDALKHKFFEEPPLPIDPSVFPTWPAKSEMGHRKAAAASPKPPSGGRQFKDLRDDDGDPTGFFLGGIQGDRRPPVGPGFNLKF